MITIGDKQRDFLNLLGAFLWAFVVFASWAGGSYKNNALVYAGLLASALLVGIYYLQGAVINEKMSKLVLFYPTILNVVLWIVAFSFTYFTKGEKMDFIMGMHPGFFGAIVFFWLGSFVCTALSFALLFKSEFLPEDVWENFMREVEQSKRPPTVKVK